LADSRNRWESIPMRFWSIILTC